MQQHLNLFRRTVMLLVAITAGSMLIATFGAPAGAAVTGAVGSSSTSGVAGSPVLSQTGRSHAGSHKKKLTKAQRRRAARRRAAARRAAAAALAAQAAAAAQLQTTARTAAVRTSTPKAPTGLAASLLTSTSVKLTWNAVSGAISYDLYDNGAYLNWSTVPSISLTGLLPGSAHSFQVLAKASSSVFSAKSTALAVTMLPAAPAVPTGLVAAGVTSTAATISWTAVATATSYRVFRGGTLVASPTTPTATDSGLAAGSTYSYTVAAVNGGGSSATSAPLSVATTAAAVTTPDAPTGLAASALTSTSVTLSWNAVAGAVSYDVYDNGAWLNWSTTASIALAGLAPGSSHSFQIVTKVSSTLFSARSTALAVTTPASATASTMPVGDLPGWKTVLAEDFNTAAPLGSFLSTYAGTMGAYPAGWQDTSKYGTYDPGRTLSVSGGVMDTWLHYDATLGKYLVNAATPKLPTMLYGRFAMRMKADRIAGYKIAPLLWPDTDSWNDGELDFPEGDLNGSNFSAFTHHAGAPSVQDWLSAGVNGDNWHTYEIAWSPNRVEYFVDGVSKGVHTTAIPYKAMHWVLQFETQIGSGAPPTTSSGHVQIDWVKAYSYSP